MQISNTNMDNLLTMLENATHETDLLLSQSDNFGVLNEADIYTRVNNIFDKINDTFNLYPKVKGSYNIDELQQLVTQVRKIRITGDHKVHIYSNMQNPNPKNTLNITPLFDYVMNAIKDHSVHHEQYFDQSKIIGEAIANACKSCTGTAPARSMTLNEFKYQYQLAVFGGFTKWTLPPRTPTLINNATKVPIMIKIIDNRLIHQHISYLENYKSELLDEFKRLQEKSPKLEKYFTSYAHCIEAAIQTTLSLYKIMRGVYQHYDIEFRQALKRLIELDKSLNETPGPETYLLETASFISSAVKPLRSISKELTVLTESASPDTDYNISESLTNFIADFKSRAQKEKENRGNQRSEYLLKMGTILRDVGKLNAPGVQVRAYETINTELNFDEYIAKFDQNLDFIKDILEHSDKYANKDLKFFIGEFVPSDLQGCIPDTSEDKVNIGVLLSNISKKICGENRYIDPDIAVMSKNIVSIPNYLGIIDSHINNLCSLIEHTINELAISSNINGELKMVIDNITNACFAYLAIILNIYKDLSIIEDSAINAVTAISEINTDSIPM